MCFLYFFFFVTYFHTRRMLCVKILEDSVKKNQKRLAYFVLFTELYLTSCNYHGFTLSINFNLSYAET